MRFLGLHLLCLAGSAILTCTTILFLPIVLSNVQFFQTCSCFCQLRSSCIVFAPCQALYDTAALERRLTQLQQSLGILQSPHYLPLLVDGVAEVVQHCHLVQSRLLSSIKLLQGLFHPQLSVVVVCLGVGDFRQLITVFHCHGTLVFHSWKSESNPAIRNIPRLAQSIF